MRAFATAAAVMLCLAARAAAQDVTGSIEGRVLTTDASAVADADITATSSTLLGIRTTKTDAAGRFRLPALPVGVYRLQLRRLGYRPTIVESIRVRLGETATLTRIILESQALTVLSPVTISADNAGDASATAASTTLSATRLDDLPTGRNFRDVAQLLPQATPSFLGDGINVAGATGLENHYFVDGVDITTPLYADRSIDLPYNFLKEVQVRTGGSSAEDAQALGAVVNVVTPNGGNRFTANAFAFFSSDNLQASVRETVGAKQTGFRFYDAGATLGGPIARDRAWFFLAYNPKYERRELTYSFGPSSDVTTVHQFAAKITSALGAHTTTILSVIGDPRYREAVTLPLATLPGPTPLNAEVLQQHDHGGGVGVALRSQTVLGPAVLVESSIAQMRQLEAGRPESPAGDAPIFVDYLETTLSGGHGYHFHHDTRRRTAKIAISWRPSNHTLKIGAQHEVLRDIEVTEIKQILKVSPQTFIQYFHTNTSPGRAENRNPSAFVQDVWQPTPRLNLSGGLRVSRQNYVNLNASTGTARIHDGVQPRVGVVYQIGELGSQRVFASYARVVDQVAMWATGLTEAGADAVTIYPNDPRVDAGGGVSAPGSPYILTGAGFPSDPNLRATTVDDWSIGYGRQFAGRLSLSVRATRRSLLDDVYAGSNEGMPRWGNPGRDSMSVFPRPTRTYDALSLVLQRFESDSTWYQLSYILSRTHGNRTGDYSSDWRLPVPHYGPLYGFREAWRNSTGLLPNDRTHVLKAFGGHSFATGVTVGMSLFGGSGTPLSEYTKLASGDLAFASQRGTAGRTPFIWDLDVRASYDTRSPRVLPSRSRVLLDIQHLGSLRKAVDYDQLHYGCPANNSACLNGSYGRVTQYQPPMTVRLGLETAF